MTVRVTRHTTVLVVSLGLLLFGVTPGRSTPRVSNGLIVFASDRDERGGIFVMNPDGSGQTNITNDPASDYSPAASPDGTRIAFSSDREGFPGETAIYAMNPDGSGVSRVGPPPTYAEEAWGPAWSPDGTKIAFVARELDNYDLWIMDADGANVDRIFYDGIDESSPTWSLDGRFIAYERGSGLGNSELWLMRANGTGRRVLYDAPGGQSTPDWSPAGARIVFAVQNGTRGGLFTIKRDGSDLKQLTHDPSDYDPAWSPDGKKIVFVRDVDETSDIFVINADGTGLTRLTTAPGSDYMPDWAPAT